MLYGKQTSCDNDCIAYVIVAIRRVDRKLAFTGPSALIMRFCAVLKSLDSFYTKIDPRNKGGDTRTFIILPSKDSQTKSTLKYFTGNKNSNAANEVDACACLCFRRLVLMTSHRHVSMFSQANDGGHDLAIKTVAMITDWMS